jgi:citrate lyase subunit beta/citryl-CoA lyase
MQKSPFEQLVIAREFRVRRTELTCPAHSMKMMTKAAESAADEVILDLEDSCAVSQKIEARKTLIEALNTLDFRGKIRAFRPNNIRTRFCYRDIVEVVEAAGRNIDVVVIPKVYGPEDVLFVDRLLSQIEENVGLEQGRIKLEVLIESARSLLHAEEIATCTPRMSSLIFGIADFAGDIGARLSGDQFTTFHYAKAQTITAARAAGIDVIDNVTLQFKDLEQVRRDAEAGAELGFDGKWAIHPSHIEIINAAYTPTREEIKRARAILEAYARADTEHGQGAIVFEDEMVDAATLRVEWKKLVVARKAGLVDEQYQLLDAPAGGSSMASGS